MEYFGTVFIIFIIFTICIIFMTIIYFTKVFYSVRRMKTFYSLLPWRVIEWKENFAFQLFIKIGKDHLFNKSSKMIVYNNFGLENFHCNLIVLDFKI